MSLDTDKDADKVRPICPEVVVHLTGQNGNALNLIMLVKKALEREGWMKTAEVFQNEAMSSDYNNVLKTCMRYVTVR